MASEQGNKEEFGAQELLNIIAQDLEKFDSVCMATSIHTLANLHCTKAQYQAVFDSPEMLRLMAAVCESSLQLQSTVHELCQEPPRGSSHALLHLCLVRP